MTARELTVREAAELLKAQDNILVVCHAHPDGDAVGSGVALERMLTVLGKTAYLVCADTVPHQLRFLLGYRPCGRAGDADALRPELLPEEFSPSFIVTVDVASIELTGMAERLEGKVDLKIDHHSMGGDFAPLSLMYRGSSACGEVIYDLAEQLSFFYWRFHILSQLNLLSQAIFLSPLHNKRRRQIIGKIYLPLHSMQHRYRCQLLL